MQPPPMDSEHPEAAGHKIELKKTGKQTSTGF